MHIQPYGEVRLNMGSRLQRITASTDMPETRSRQIIAVDGKALTGSARLAAPRRHLLSAVTHDRVATMAQVEVGAKTNEVRHFKPLLAPLDLADTVVTFDALHSAKANITWLVETKKAHYIAVIKTNQPYAVTNLAAHQTRPPSTSPPPTIHTGTAPRAMATTRNLAIGTLKILGADNIAKTTRAIRHGPERALAILGITHTTTCGSQHQRQLAPFSTRLTKPSGMVARSCGTGRMAHPGNNTRPPRQHGVSPPQWHTESQQEKYWRNHFPPTQADVPSLFCRVTQDTVGCDDVYIRVNGTTIRHAGPLQRLLPRTARSGLDQANVHPPIHQMVDLKSFHRFTFTVDPVADVPDGPDATRQQGHGFLPAEKREIGDAQ
ncbi:hypothetical protein [Kitasatospora purpeofusca]|uniref:Transposase IS4-like domain-containing protein n=1 Tax=Kitasatospora purpeofusca TaxID=67352 RepID=A0ABZ1UBT2_9ACTN|nr:hypothetical protein [Kitasatospora purpeofusca]